MDNKNFCENKIKLNDLLDETNINIDTDEHKAYAVFKDDLAEFTVLNNCTSQVKNQFFSTCPQTELTTKFNKILHTTSQNNDKLLTKKLTMEFDKKMARINKIKSKHYKKMLRKDRKKDSKLYEELSISVDENSSSTTQNNLHVNSMLNIKYQDNSTSCIKDTTNNILRKNVNIVEDIFEENDSSESNDSFIQKKIMVMKDEAPAIEEIILPGFDGEWAGSTIDTKQTIDNTVKYIKNGVPVYNRADFTKSNVIISENIQYNDKYNAKLSSKYNKDLYKKKLKINITTRKNHISESEEEIVCKQFLNE